MKKPEKRNEHRVADRSDRTVDPRPNPAKEAKAATPRAPEPSSAGALDKLD